MSVKRILVVAGSDSSGGAGLEADQRVIAAHGCYAMTATAALTAQNTQGVRDIHVTPPQFVRKQIDACIEDVGVDVVKTGMFASAETVCVVAESLQRFNIATSVIDPVMVATTGAQLLPQEAVQNFIHHLLPKATILTPNLPEARLFLQESGHGNKPPSNVDDLVDMTKSLQALGPQYVLLKGGHLPMSDGRVVSSVEADKNLIVDVLVGNEVTEVLETPYIDSNNTHGTGCSLASAIASHLANGKTVLQAVKAARNYVEAGIRASFPIGSGNGPINHFHSSYILPFAPGKFVEYVLERADVKPIWREHTHHNFVNRMADGTLPQSCFKYFLVQDYLYLFQFSRAHSLAGYKAKTLEDVNASARIVQHIREEMNLHLKYCEEFGLTKDNIENEEESIACTAYTRYLLDIGQSEDWFALQIAFAPCLLGYGMIARRLYDDPGTVKEGNPYWKWIVNYTEQDFVTAMETGAEILEKNAVKQSPSRIEELITIFKQAIKMEIGFWDMGSRGN